MTEEASGGPAGRRSYPKGVRRRQQILESAIALFAQRGVDSASLRTVGEAIGRAAEGAGPDLDRFAAKLRTWFRDWAAEGFFRTVEHTD